MRTLVIDNYDSFTFNLYQLIAEVNGEAPWVVRNDEATWEELSARPFDNVVLSPGPGRPERAADFGVCARAIAEAKVPLLGVCLGHQGLCQAFGARVTAAPTPVHGRPSRVRHSGSGLFAGLSQPFLAVRYHSLVVAGELPPELEALAWSEDDGQLMAVRHRQRPLWGVQFHPESILTEGGVGLLRNFRELTRAWAAAQGRPGAGTAQSSQSPSLPSLPKSSSPSLPKPAAVAERPASAGLVVRHRRLTLDVTPERVFAALYAERPIAFWLDSALGGRGRFSFIGAADGPHALTLAYRVAPRRLTVVERGEARERDESLFAFLERELERRQVRSHELPFDFNGGFVGYFGYELKADCGAAARHRSPLPDARLLFADRLLAFDHQERALYLVACGRAGEAEAAERWFDATAATLLRLAATPDEAPAPRRPIGALDWRLARARDLYLADIGRCRDEIARGESYEVCLTNRLAAPAHLDAFACYRLLRRSNPAPYAAFLRFPDVAVACASPERFLRLDRDGVVEARPIKGTRPRAERPDEDARLAAELAAAEKDRAENLMIVDLMRNDLGRVCAVGSVHVPALMEVESYATVHHLVSTVRGRLRTGLGAVDCLRAAFPAGSMTGAPKLRTMEILDGLEGEARGVYSGAIGYLGLGGGADLNVVIRSAVLTAEGVSIGAGGAVTALSDPDAELNEMLLKAAAIQRACVAAPRS